jgi:hypothetical protein
MRYSVLALGLVIHVLTASTVEIGTAGFPCNKPFCAN